ncbi:uncharacterized protein LOC141901581 isoform X2 [Tubulanus polymorphus]|uniref:uncharacterized protein LOC141901581 isoform X2 n=1 Tax=Tubulanus polymorphus TaxID=672921 RepID=UPI003DA3995A
MDPSAMVIGSSQQRSKMIKIGVIGCGHWGKDHVRVLIERGSLAGVCDSDAAAIAAIRQTKPDVIVYSLDEMLADASVEGVVIATPDRSHFDLAERALRAGKHVLVETPMTTSYAQARALVRLADERRLLVTTGYHMLHQGAVRMMLRSIESGAIGDVTNVRTHRYRRRSCANIQVHWSLGPHDVAVILAINGCRLPRRLRAVGEPTQEVDIRMEFGDNGDDGALKTMSAIARGFPVVEHKIVVNGTEGAFVFNDTLPRGQKLKFYPAYTGQDAASWLTLTPDAGDGGFFVACREEELLMSEHSAFAKAIESNGGDGYPESWACNDFGAYVACVLELAHESLLTDGSWRIVDEYLNGQQIRAPNSRKENDKYAPVHGNPAVQRGSASDKRDELTAACPHTDLAMDGDISQLPLVTNEKSDKRCKPLHQAVVGSDETCDSSRRAPTATAGCEPPPPAPITLAGLERQLKVVDKPVKARVISVIDSCKFIFGPEMAQLGGELSRFCGCKHVITCACGTDALRLALTAKGATRPHQAVFVPANTCCSTVEAIIVAGATPVFVDVRQDTYNMDETSLAKAIELARGSSLEPTGVVVVDLYGMPADYDAIGAVARVNDLWVLEDAAQSFGAERNGVKVGNICEITITSFYPAKGLGCFGDGGAVLTNSDELAAAVWSLRAHGRSPDHKYHIERVGMNSRLDTLQAAVLLEKLKIFPGEIESRRRIAERYRQLLSPHGVTTPTTPAGVASSWTAYTVVLPTNCDRSRVIDDLERRHRVQTGVFYEPGPQHKLPAFADYLRPAMTVVDGLQPRILSLPVHPYLRDDEVERVARALVECVRNFTIKT